MAWVRLFRRQAGGNLGKVYQPGSVLSLAPTKGLFNEPGQNSCFLNSAVQVLWQLDIFRRSLRGLTGHVCLGDACIFCALKSIFAQFQTSREKVLPSDAMRHALAESFKDEHRFQLGLMDDAAECFENILQRIHFHIVPNSEGDMCTSKSCITHQKFAMTLYEQCVCRSCGASSDPLPFTEFVRYISTTALCKEVDRMLERHERLKPEMFAELLQAANTADDFRKCPSNCGQKIKIRRVLMNCPEIVTIGLVWDSDNSDLTEDVVRNLATQLYLPGLFFRVTDEYAKESRLYLVGMICYTSHHYCAFAYHTKSARWFLFDDASVKEVGTKWKDVVTKCIRCHYQPLLLFYANPDGTAVSTEDSLRQVMQWSHYKSVIPRAEDVGNERLTAAPKKSELGRDHQFSEHNYQNNGHKFHMDDSGFNRGIVQASAGRGPVKIIHKDQQEKLKVLSKECAQRAVDLKSISSAQRKIVDKPQKREVPRPKESSGGMVYQSKSFSGVQLKSGSPPAGNGFRRYPDQPIFSSQGRGPYKPERPVHQSRQVPSSTTVQAPAPEIKQASRMKNNVSIGYETDNSQEYKGRGNIKNKKTWRPTRETLNVDSIFNENDRSQQTQRHLENLSGKQQVVKDQNFNHCAKESPKCKVLMTIYEDEIKQESGSRSSLESLGKGQIDRNKQHPDNKMYHLDSWQMQRTESGYESSDHISSGSSNLDSPVIEGTSFTDVKGLQEISLYSDQQGSVGISTSPQTRSHFTGFHNEHNGDLEHNRYEDRLSPDPRDPARSPLVLRKQVTDPKREVRSMTGYKDYSLKDKHMSRLDDIQESSHWLSSSSSENSSLHSEHSPSFRETQVIQSKLLNSNGVIHSHLQQSPATSGSFAQNSSQSRLQYMNVPFAFNEKSNQAYSREGNCYSDPNLNSLPPPLPPKKYNRSAVPRAEQTAAPTVHAKLQDTLSRVHLNCAERIFTGDTTRLEPEVDYYPRREAFHGNELHINNPNLAGSSVFDYKTSMIHPHTVGLDTVSPELNDIISLTTYFSVDNCMTDTYRMKYHQRPRMFMAESTELHREPGHLQLAEVGMDPGYPRTLDNTHPSLASRSKPTYGGIPCNR